jgi:predicted MFS family arabinose efflux permease
VLTRRGVLVLVAVALATTVSQAFGRFTYAVLLPDIRDDLGLSNTVAGSLGSMNLGAYLVGSLIVTLVVGSLGLAAVAKAGLAGVTAGLVLLAWSPSVWVTATGLVLTGVSAAGVWVTAPALATAELGADRRGTAIGVVTGGIGVGMVISSWLHHFVAWRHVYRFEALVGALAMVAVTLLLRRVPAPRGGRHGLIAIRTIEGWRPLLVVYGLFAAAMAMAITFLVALLQEDAGYSSARAAVAFSMVGVGTILGGPVFGPLADRAGRRFALLSSLVLLVVTILVASTGHRPGATVAALGFGLAFTGVPVSVGARISDFVDGEHFGAAYGVATLAFGAGLSVGPQLGGFVSDRRGSFRPAFLVAAAVAALGAVLVPYATRRDATRRAVSRPLPASATET